MLPWENIVLFKVTGQFKGDDFLLYSPKWSKAKKRLKSFVCESLQSKVDFQVINYRKAHDQRGRVVITVDKVEKLSMCTIVAGREEFYKVWEIRRTSENYYFEDVNQNRNIQDEAHQRLKKEEVYAQYDFFSALENYFSSNIEELLKSNDSLMKILSLLDRRVGKRRLRQMQARMIHESELVNYFYELRCNAENIYMAR